MRPTKTTGAPNEERNNKWSDIIVLHVAEVPEKLSAIFTKHTSEWTSYPETPSDKDWLPKHKLRNVVYAVHWLNECSDPDGVHKQRGSTTECIDPTSG